VAYVRFASVYRQFKDINTFKEELNKCLRRNDAKPLSKKAGGFDIKDKGHIRLLQIPSFLREGF
jgi:hypothetical protein